MKKIRLLLIEDNRLLLNGIISILKTHKEIIIIAASGNERNSLSKIHQLKPNVVLLDLGLRSQNSLHVVEKVKHEFPQAKIIVMDLAPIKAEVLQYVKAGANGFILKDSSPKVFLTTIRKVTEGSTVLPPFLGDSLFSEIVNQTVREDKSRLKRAVRMTKREGEVIRLIDDGMSHREIGQNIHVSVNNVKSNIHNIIEKLVLRSILEIAN